jgi:hypothetical protein
VLEPPLDNSVDLGTAKHDKTLINSPSYFRDSIAFNEASIARYIEDGTAHIKAKSNLGSTCICVNDEHGLSILFNLM